MIVLSFARLRSKSETQAVNWFAKICALRCRQCELSKSGYNTVREGRFDQYFIDDDSRKSIVRASRHAFQEVRYTYSHGFVSPLCFCPRLAVYTI